MLLGGEGLWWVGLGTAVIMGMFGLTMAAPMVMMGGGSLGELGIVGGIIIGMAMFQCRFVLHATWLRFLGL